MRYDAAVIGAGAEGLAAAVMLAQEGRKVIVVERSAHHGGRCVMREFHPGFHASPFCDDVQPIPSHIFWSLDLGRRGCVFLPRGRATALWMDRARAIKPSDSRLLRDSAARTKAILSHAARIAQCEAKRSSLFSRNRDECRWPDDDVVTQSLSRRLSHDLMEGDSAALIVAQALCGRAAHPDLAGSGLHLLAPGAGRSGPVWGGLPRLADALHAAASDAGAEFSFGLDVTDIRRRRGRANALGLADGSEISARAIISTLDLKRTFLSLFAWSDLPAEVSVRARTFRMAGSAARLLFALRTPPRLPAFADDDLFRGPIHVAPDMTAFGSAYAAWRTGMASTSMPVTLCFPSAADPALCPLGAAIMTATVTSVPSRLFDGAWTHERRAALQEHTLNAAESVLPGIKSLVIGCEIIVPPDMEEALGLTDGDLEGGEIAADQMLGLRPGFETAEPRTPIDGLYLTSSTTASVLGTCAAGVNAAAAVIADLKGGRLG